MVLMHSIQRWPCSHMGLRPLKSSPSFPTFSRGKQILQSPRRESAVLCRIRTGPPLSPLSRTSHSEPFFEHCISFFPPLLSASFPAFCAPLQSVGMTACSSREMPSSAASAGTVSSTRSVPNGVSLLPLSFPLQAPVFAPVERGTAGGGCSPSRVSHHLPLRSHTVTFPCVQGKDGKKRGRRGPKCWDDGATNTVIQAELVAGKQAWGRPARFGQCLHGTTLEAFTPS